MKAAAIGLLVVATTIGGMILRAPAHSSVEWASPIEHHVQAGDTAESVAQAYGVAPDDVVAWNGGDHWLPGSTLLVWPTGDEAVEGTGIEIPSALQFLSKKDPPATRKTAGRPSPVASPRGADHIEPEEQDEPATSKGEVPVIEGEDPAATLARLRALKGANLDSSDVDLKMVSQSKKGRYKSGTYNDVVRDMFKKDDTAGLQGTVAKWRAGHTNGNDRPASSQAQAAAPARVAPSVPRLSRPAAKQCLSGPTGADLQGDHGMVSNKGLNKAQIQSSMKRFSPKTLSCLRSQASFRGTLEVEITSECNGRVRDVSIVDNQGVPADVATCVKSALHFAGFPAHDMPDGDTFGYRMNIAR